MKKYINKLVALLVLTGSMAVAGQAQTNGRLHLRATIPFEFNVGQKTMPAGEYTITQINPSSDRTVLQLRRSDGRSSTLVQMNNVIGKAGDGARLVFSRYGRQHYFSQLWTSSGEVGWEAPRVRPDLAGLKPARETVAVNVR